jgi:hypothetical protein
VKTPQRRLQFVADWLDDRKANSKSKELRKHYEPLIAKAEKDKEWDTKQQLLHEWDFENDSVFHPVYARKIEKLTAKARRYGISVPRQPADMGAESEDWYMSQVYGFWLPREKLEERLRREVRDEKRASYDEFRKWATLVFAVVGAALAFMSVVSKQKQPDPCSRNYYRSDSGDCVFASPKGAAPQAQPSSPAPAGRH